MKLYLSQLKHIKDFKINNCLILCQAQIHKKKVDVCNSRAAACLLSSHKKGNTLDLHFLHVMEAEVVLDMFLDEIISDIGQQRRRHRTVFIITGRGLRSRGGVSRIKPMVLRKLQARKLQ